jgi:hypothetical protein
MEYTGRNRGIMALLALFMPGPFTPHIVNAAYQIASLFLLPICALLFYRWWQKRLTDFTLFTGVAIITYLLLPNNSSADQMFLLLPLLLWMLNHSAQQSPVRWLWLIFLIYSYLVFFAQVLGLVPYAVVSGQLVFFLAWVAWRWLAASGMFMRKMEQKQV